ncbi:unnamed protein product [[Candida] boidinii]|uniref:acid phosphatase n=1 Tax=Candida boidinii TaxID=5477 RepID=A0A9W6WJG1_CANBO|nr:hypothetical protein B5S30_g3228 [[Candida] boidinii]OWB85373.1 hypothetical protein B5S33_g4038 [[Candida] boidinii]GME74008.1 unnamed protein product [[Candida] boidinii]GMF04540.1 unnamed protein product [[Candida] boidinii]GMF98028.1 unnamed protein product [[Candida] boidinii]
MKFSTVLKAAALASAASATVDLSTVTARNFTSIQPTIEEIEAAASNATTLQWTSDVEGAFFKRFFVIWLENTDYDKAFDEEDFQWIAEQGITLTNYWAVTHPSEPNYMASVGGDYFALDDDRFIALPENISTIVDLLEEKGISWAEYQEHLPYTGFQGFNYSNQETFANDYVRKHNPLVLYDSVSNNDTRLSLIKNYTVFEQELADNVLPQYAIFTPNMTNDGHDTTTKFVANYAKSFLEPLLSNENFTKDTLILLTFDENDSYSVKNNVLSILLGGVIPEELKGTFDNTFYDHYSQLSSLEANFDLHHLGRGDVDANIFQLVANATGIENKDVDTEFKVNNETYIGYLNDINIEIPAPNVTATNRNGKAILPAISSVWAEEYSAQVSESYFTATTTTVSGDITNAVTLTTAGISKPASVAASGSASGSAKASGSVSGSAKASASGSASASASSSSSKAGAVALGVSIPMVLTFLANVFLL